jgi:hypothetical protein
MNFLPFMGRVAEVGWGIARRDADSELERDFPTPLAFGESPLPIKGREKED